METGAQSLTIAAMLLPFFGAIVAPALTQMLGRNAAWPLALIPALIFLHFTGFLTEIAAGGSVTGGFDWIPSLGVRISWFIDGLSLTFALLISGIGTLIVLYSGGYLAGHAQQGRFFAFILLFMGAMQGVIVADSFLMLFVFWELTSIASFLLIGFDHAREASRRAALQALVVTGLGGLSLLAGLLVISAVTGVEDLSALVRSGGGFLRESDFYMLALILVLGGAFTKSAQFPFHFWLPNAMEAPTPVSAYLHSATMVKAGVYLLMRMNPVLGDTIAWETILPLFGGMTLLVGSLLAVAQTDLKLMLAYTTVASLGMLVMLTGWGTEEAIIAAVLYLVAHALFKGALFMVSGLIDHETGARDTRFLGGLRRAMPITFAAGLLAALSMGGLPFFWGFLAKEEIYAALATGGRVGLVPIAVAVTCNALMFAVAFFVGLKPFVGKAGETPNHHPHEGPALLWIGPLALAVCGLLAALFFAGVHVFVSSPMATAVAGFPLDVRISAIPHLGIPLLLSAVTIALGVALYRLQNSLRLRMSAFLAWVGWGPDQGFDQAMRGLIKLACAVTRFLHNGRLDAYMAATFCAVAAMVLVPLVMFGELPSWPEFPSLLVREWAVVLIAAVGVVVVVRAADRVTAIVSLGIQGLAVALLFMLLGAPDLSFTQFMVETLSVVILALAMTRLNLSPLDRRSAGTTLRDLIIATASGLGFALLLLKVTQLPFDGTMTRFFEAHSLAIAHGRNIVNVIIVDFRGLDTLGEIAVVMITGLAILALIKGRTVGDGGRRRGRKG